MRVIVAALICGGVLAGSTVLVAQRADTAGAQRARMIAVLSANMSGDCDCTAGTRARDRIASKIAESQTKANKIAESENKK